jgi:hypothetical protein
MPTWGYSFSAASVAERNERTMKIAKRAAITLGALLFPSIAWAVTTVGGECCCPLCCG